jgi:Ca-activated chloride channel homolog
VAHPLLSLAAALATVAMSALPAQVGGGPGQGEQPRSVFKGEVDLVKVPVHVTDRARRFVSGLTKDDFAVFDDGRRQEIVTFSRERVSVSLGVLVDSSTSMTPVRTDAARTAIQMLFELLGRDDELFLAEYSLRPKMLQTWTTDRVALGRAMHNLSGGSVAAVPYSALYEGVHLMLQFAGRGQSVRKAMLIVGDGYDNFSTVRERDVRQAIRGSDVTVYALGIGETTPKARKVNEGALRRLTDESGGRTDVVRSADEVRDATSRLAEEVGQQYLLGYAPPPGPVNRWHDIKVDVPMQKDVTIRARAGYTSK